MREPGDSYFIFNVIVHLNVIQFKLSNSQQFSVRVIFERQMTLKIGRTTYARKFNRTIFSFGFLSFCVSFYLKRETIEKGIRSRENKQ